MIEGKVAAIVDTSSVVINVGKSQGVRPGMRFRAIFRTGGIVDPDDPRNVLDGLTLVIGEMEATSVLDRFTYCRVENPVKPKNNLTIFAWAQTESVPLIDTDQPQLAGPEELKIRVGTSVQECKPKADPTPT